MKTNGKMYSASWIVMGIFLFLIFISSAASAGPLTVTETRITKNVSDQVYPDIYGKIVVWQDNRNGNWDIYMCNLSDKKETRITKNVYNQTEPAIWGDKIVWIDKRNSAGGDSGGIDIYMYNVSTKKETRITKRTIPVDPDVWITVQIDGNKIVWGPGSEYDIYVYDFSTRGISRQQNIDTGIPLYNIAFSGNRIVGTDDLDGEEGIVYMYNLSTSTATPITTEDSAYGGPDISGNRIVWEDIRNSDIPDEFDLYMYDLSTSAETRITSSPTVAWGIPNIFGNRVVWEDIRDGGSNIYMYEISTSDETQITTSGSAYNPRIYTPRLILGGPSIVWQDDRNGNWDIYMATIRSRIIAMNTNS